MVDKALSIRSVEFEVCHGVFGSHLCSLVFPGGSDVKCLPTMRETWVQSLGLEDLLEKEMETHSSILAWRDSTDRGAWWATVLGVARSRTRLSDFTFTFLWFG